MSATRPEGVKDSARRLRVGALASLAVILSLGSWSPALAQPNPESDARPPAAQPSARPWAEGVSPEDRTRALALFAEGNQAWDDALFAEAANKYRAAAEHWAHPGIHYNLAKALIHLEQPVEAYASVLLALAYGPDALARDQYREAENYKTLLSQQLAVVHGTCDVDGAEVTLDGERWFSCPSRQTRMLEPGEHAIVATKDGHLPAQEQVLLMPGTEHTVTLVLQPLADVAVVEISCRRSGARVTLGQQSLLTCPGSARKALPPGDYKVNASRPGHLAAQVALRLTAGQREKLVVALVPLAATEPRPPPLPGWTPWVTAASGAGLLAVGGLLRWRAGANYSRFDREFQELCPSGCELSNVPTELDDTRARARAQNRIGIGVGVAGGVAVLAGATLWALNRPRAVEVPAGIRPAASTVRPGAVSLHLGPAHLGLSGWF